MRVPLPWARGEANGDRRELVRSEKYAVLRHGGGTGRCGIAACVARALQRCPGRACMAFLLLPQEIRRVDNTCSQFYPKTLDRVVQYIPSLSHKGSVLHYKFTPVKSRTCLLHMFVAQSPACHACTDGRPQRAGEPGDACRERARDKNAGIVRTVTRRGGRTPLTRRAMPHPAYTSATSLRLASVSPSM